MDNKTLNLWRQIESCRLGKRQGAARSKFTTVRPRQPANDPI